MVTKQLTKETGTGGKIRVTTEELVKQIPSHAGIPLKIKKRTTVFKTLHFENDSPFIKKQYTLLVDHCTRPSKVRIHCLID